MTLTITLKPEIEEWLHEQSLVQHVSEEEIVVHELESRWAVAHTYPQQISATESHLLQKINEGFPEAFWQRFGELRAKLEAEALTESERQEFLRDNEAIEEKNAERMEHLLELADLRGTALPEIMRHLGISPIQAA